MLMKAAGVKDVGENSFIAFRKEDNKRISAAMQKVQKKYKIWRLTRKRTATSVILQRSTMKLEDLMLMERKCLQRVMVHQRQRNVAD